MNKFLLALSLCIGMVTTCPADDTYLGKLSANPYGADSTANPYGEGISIHADDDG